MNLINKLKELTIITLITSIIGCVNPKYQEKEAEIKIREDNLKEINNNPITKKSWENLAEYQEFVESTVNKNYQADISEIYNFYNIKREIPKYGFKSKNIQNICFDCTGAVYKENSDSIYFYSTCSPEIFQRYVEYHNKDKKEIEEYFTERIHHYIKHEAAHAFYYLLGKEMGEDYLFSVKRNNTSILYDIQHSLVEEGVADYIAYKGELTPSAKLKEDKDFKKMIEEESDLYLYDLGFILVKPILDKDFNKGIIELIKNPLSKKDLSDLPEYRNKILKKLE